MKNSIITKFVLHYYWFPCWFFSDKGGFPFQISYNYLFPIGDQHKIHRSAAFRFCTSFKLVQRHPLHTHKRIERLELSQPVWKTGTLTIELYPQTFSLAFCSTAITSQFKKLQERSYWAVGPGRRTAVRSTAGAKLLLR